MAKKKIDLGMIATLCAVVLGVIAVIMLVAPAVVHKYSDSVKYSGWDLAFGYKEGGESIFDFSFMNFLTYALAIAGIVCTILSYLGKGGKYIDFIATGAFILAGIFFFLAIPFSVISGSEEATAKEIAELKDEFFKVGAGVIISGICSILAGLACGYKIIKK